MSKNASNARKFIKHNYMLWLLPPSVWRKLIRLIAIMVTWYFHQSLWMAVLAWLFSLPYLAYVLITRGFANGTFMEMVKYYFIQIMIFLEIIMYCFILGMAVGMGYFFIEFIVFALIDLYKGFKSS